MKMSLPVKSFPLAGRQTGMCTAKFTAVASFITDNVEQIIWYIKHLEIYLTIHLDYYAKVVIHRE
jgi:hypothetical protein